jgi:hypothetical protein
MNVHLYNTYNAVTFLKNTRWVVGTVVIPTSWCIGIDTTWASLSNAGSTVRIHTRIRVSASVSAECVRRRLWSVQDGVHQ